MLHRQGRVRPFISSFGLLPAAGFCLCLASVPLACSFGALGLAFGDVFGVLSGALTGSPLPESVQALSPEGLPQTMDGRVLRTVVMELRLPRVILSLLAGAGLAVAGAVFQAILRNPLADPFTLGVSGGAAFGAALAISLGLTGAFWGFGLPLAAFAGAGAALFAVLMLGRFGGGLRHETLILAGVVVSAFLAALIALVKALDEASVTGIVFWIMGSFQGRGGADLLLLLPGFCLGCGLALLLARELDILSLGDRAARHLGLNTAGTRLVLLLAAGALTASCVAVSGIIGFVGLIVPHLVRMLLGAAHRRLLPVSALAGGLLLLWSDTAARTVLPGGVELPVGVITALLGGPFFCFILGRRQGRAQAAPPALGPVDRAEPGAEADAPHPRLAKPAPRPASTRPAPEPGPHVLCTGLAYHYGPRGGTGKPALRDISFSLERGEFAGLLGANGSGKSTLLHCISGLLPPSFGTVLVNGSAIADQPEKRRALQLASLPQHPESVPPLTAFELALMGRYAHTPFLGAYSQADKNLALAALAESGAAHLAGRSANCLSGGELQRVLLARCLAQEAELLLLDEATAGLDPNCAMLVLNALARRNREQGLSIIAAMHDLNLAALYCRRLIILKEGRIVADGPSKEVLKAETLSLAFDTEMTVISHPLNGLPQALPTAQGGDAPCKG